MIHYSTVVSIKRAPGDVFDALIDADTYGQWTEMVDTQFDATPPQVGTRGAFRFASGPLKGTYAMEILDADRGRRLDMRIDGSSLRWMSQISLEPEGDVGTRMTYEGDISLLGWRRVLEPLFSREVQAGEAKEVERFRELLETKPT
jgi:uncharacterized protein YndB with AHSA1/START domain